MAHKDEVNNLAEIGQLDMFKKETKDMVDDVMHPKKDDEDDSKTKSVKEMFGDENLEKKTDLNQRQILAVLRLQMFADQFDNTVVRSLAKKFMQLQISKGRIGRKELTEITRSILNDPYSDFGSGLDSRLWGK